jgi:hypothetical protein
VLNQNRPISLPPISLIGLGTLIGTPRAMKRIVAFSGKRIETGKAHSPQGLMIRSSPK